MDLQELKIGVLAGGISSEREISLESAEQAFNSLKRSGLNVVSLDISTDDQYKISQQLIQSGIDIAFIALHGAFGEDGRIQRILERLAIPYTGSLPLTSHLAMNKIAAKLIFSNNNISTPSFRVWHDSSRLPKDLKYPIVVKPYFSGSSLGISIVREQSQLPVALAQASIHQDMVLLEQYIQGREFTVSIFDGTALPIIEIITDQGNFDFNTKYSDGKAQFVVPANIDEKLYFQIQDMAQKAHSCLGCRHFSRVDILISEENIPYVLEVNTIPGLTSHSLFPLSAKAAGIGFDDLILRLTSLVLYGKEKKTQKV